MNGISGRGTDAVEMGNKSGANGGVSEVTFHHTKFALRALFPSVELDSLVFYRLEFTLMCSISVYVSDNTRVFEIYDGVVDEESGGGGSVKDIEVIILDPRVTEVGGGICMCMKGNGVLRVSSLANPYNVSVNSDLPKGDVLHYLVLTILIEEDEGVLLCITAVVLTPSSSWMIRVVKLFSELGNIGNGARGGGKGDSGVICSESDWFVVLNIFI